MKAQSRMRASTPDFACALVADPWSLTVVLSPFSSCAFVSQLEPLFTLGIPRHPLSQICVAGCVVCNPKKVRIISPTASPF